MDPGDQHPIIYSIQWTCLMLGQPAPTARLHHKNREVRSRDLCLLSTTEFRKHALKSHEAVLWPNRPLNAVSDRHGDSSSANRVCKSRKLAWRIEKSPKVGSRAVEKERRNNCMILLSNGRFRFRATWEVYSRAEGQEETNGRRG